MAAFGLRYFAFSILFVSGQTAAQDEADRLEWLRQHTVAVRSIEPKEADDSDLLRLGKAISSARIVMLGEAAHGSGEALKAKVRLVKFLHERLGFSVLVWESGFYGCHVVDALLRSEMNPVEAAERGVFNIWQQAAEVAPLFEHAQRSHRTAHPLHMAGYDAQTCNLATNDGLAKELHDLVARIHDEVPRANATGILDRAVKTQQAMIEACWRGYGLDRKKLSAEEYEAQARAFLPTDEVVSAARESASALQALFADSSTFTFLDRRMLSFFACVLENAGADVENALKGARERAGLGSKIDPEGSWNSRDAQGARNVLWLADEHYGGRKLIVWAHNFHIMNAYGKGGFSGLSTQPTEGIVPLGVQLKQRLGDEVYTILFTAYQGESSDWGPVPQRFVNRFGPAPEDSLEHRLHALEQKYLFLDFRQVANDPGHWLHAPTQLGMRGGRWESVDDWTRVMDGLFFADEAFVSTAHRK